MGVTACAFWLSFATLGQAQEASLEYAVKATYLYKIAPFVEWPPNAFESASSPFAICVLGPDPFGSFLDRVVAGQKFAERAVVVRRLATADAHSNCQILFVGGGAGHIRDILRPLHGAPVLTVTDDAGGAGIVDFVIDQGRVRFRIDDEQARADSLKISPKILSLALSVKTKRTTGLKP